MAFLENLGKKVGEAAQAAAKKSSELVEVTKLNMSINSEEDKIQKLYIQIGKGVFDNYVSTGSVADEYRAVCDEIKAHDDTIANLKAKILEVKNMKACTNCGAELERNTIFCAKCGAKQEMQEMPPVQSAAPLNQLCPACGAQVPAGSAFCTSCGAKMN